MTHCAHLSAHLGAHCVLLDYRGFADSGVPAAGAAGSGLAGFWAQLSWPPVWWPGTEAALVADARAALEWLVYEVTARR